MPKKLRKPPTPTTIRVPHPTRERSPTAPAAGCIVRSRGVTSPNEPGYPGPGDSPNGNGSADRGGAQRPPHAAGAEAGEPRGSAAALDPRRHNGVRRRMRRNRASRDRRPPLRRPQCRRPVEPLHLGYRRAGRAPRRRRPTSTRQQSRRAAKPGTTRPTPANYPICPVRSPGPVSANRPPSRHRTRRRLRCEPNAASR